MKNVYGAIELLQHVAGRVTFDIWGPIEDSAYQLRCQQLASGLPENIQVRWCGVIQPQCVGNVMSRYDAMLLPTFGENFGHAIVEALSAGCPVVISDRTPWRGLEKAGVGWDLPLDCPGTFHQAFATLTRMDEREHSIMRTRVVQYATNAVCSSEHLDAYRRLFHRAMEMGGRLRAAGLQQAA